MSPRRGRPTEVDAYIVIERKLGEIGWRTEDIDPSAVEGVASASFAYLNTVYKDVR